MKVIIFLLKEINNSFGELLSFLPGRIGNFVRYFYWRRRFKYCGKNVRIDAGIKITNPEFISIGNNVWLDNYCILIAGIGKINLKAENIKIKENKFFKGQKGELIINDNVHIAPFCLIQAHGGVYIGKNSGLSTSTKIYSYSNLPTNPTDNSDIIYFTALNKHSYYFLSPVVLEENVGCAINVIILPGVCVGSNSFIAPNSVVITSFKENSYLSGNPAKKISERFNLEK